MKYTCLNNVICHNSYIRNSSIYAKKYFINKILKILLKLNSEKKYFVDSVLFA